MKFTRFLTLVLTLLPFSLWAQGTKADYLRALNLREKAPDALLQGSVNAMWAPDGTSFWYQTEVAHDDAEFVFVKPTTGQRRVLFRGSTLRANLDKLLKKKFENRELPIEAVTMTEDEVILVRAGDKVFEFSSMDETLTPSQAELPRSLPSRKENGGHRNRYTRRDGLAPDRRQRINLEEGNLVLTDPEGNNKVALTKGETIERANYYWSPDSKLVVVMQTIPGEEHIVHVVESSPEDQVQPKLKSWRYTKPGDRINITKPRLFNIAARKEIPLSDELFKNPWHIDRLRWERDSSRFTFIYNQRGHEILRVVAVDAKTGNCSTLIEEAPDTFVNYFQKQHVSFLEERGEIIWMSERDGWNHLYRFDAKSGNLINQITNGDWLVRGVDFVDPEAKQIWFRGCGMYAGEDPYHVHYYRINFDGTGLTRLTAGDGTHSLRFSTDRKYYIDKFSRVDLPPVHELRRSSNGSLVCHLEEADISQLQAIPGWSMPERFVAKGRDGKTDIWGVIHRPSNLDPNKSYPIVEKIYAGPHGQYVPKRFYPFLTAMDIAEVGCIVVVIDGMGTNWRSKAFLDYCWKNLKDAGFPDRKLWIRAMAKKYPYMDVNRVGIYGGSAGGQNALGGMLFHPEFYKAAVADCGCHDNRMDKIHWNEGWMGLMGPHYADNSNVTHAHKLQGKLFLTVGELDTNVDPASTMQVVDALIKANKDFDLVVVPGKGHGVGEIPYLRRRRQDFFVRHLLGIEPRSR